MLDNEKKNKIKLNKITKIKHVFTFFIVESESFSKFFF